MFFGKEGHNDPLHQLQRMSMAELTYSYDFLLGILKKRETLLKKRIKESIDHLGWEERIHYQTWDFSKEQE